MFKFKFELEFMFKIKFPQIYSKYYPNSNSNSSLNSNSILSVYSNSAHMSAWTHVSSWAHICLDPRVGLGPHVTLATMLVVLIVKNYEPLRFEPRTSIRTLASFTTPWKTCLNTTKSYCSFVFIRAASVAQQSMSPHNFGLIVKLNPNSEINLEIAN
jgi:hypothetical protein